MQEYSGAMRHKEIIWEPRNSRDCNIFIKGTDIKFLVSNYWALLNLFITGSAKAYKPIYIRCISAINLHDSLYQNICRLIGLSENKDFALTVIFNYGHEYISRKMRCFSSAGRSKYEFKIFTQIVLHIEGVW